MKYLNSLTGNHNFNFKGTIITAWVVVGSKTICVSLNSFKGEWLRFTGNFKDVYEGDIEGMQKFLEGEINKLTKWLPKTLKVAEIEQARECAIAENKRIEAKKKTDKDRAIALYSCIAIKKGKHKISIVTQPYQVGIYIAISDSKVSSLIQLAGKNHAGTNRMLNKIIDKFEVEGYKVVANKRKIDYANI